VAFSLFQIGITTAIVCAGLILLWHLKWVRSPGSLSFETFFVGGGRVNATLAANNNWGLCFAFANAIWYYAFLGYYYGPWAFLLQLPWSLAVVVLSFKIVSYIRASEFGTVHGFIESRYGTRAGVLAAIATLIGYTINIGFELFYSAYLLCVALGFPDLGFIVGVFLAIFVAAYCAAGGYLANVRTDRFQNLIGLAAVLFLIVALVSIFRETTGTWNIFATKIDFAPIPWHFVLGVSTFAFFFNFVDMANWQSIAASRKLQSDELKKVSQGLIYSAAVQFLAPAFVGCCLGVMLKGMKGDLADDAYFAFAFSQTFGATYLGAILLGLVLFGLLGITISSAGSYLLASMQTLAVDVIWREKLHLTASAAETEELC
jgi:Na+/proline symporter